MMEKLMTGEGGAISQRRKSIKTYREIVEEKYVIRKSSILDRTLVSILLVVSMYSIGLYLLSSLLACCFFYLILASTYFIIASGDHSMFQQLCFCQCVASHMAPVSSCPPVSPPLGSVVRTTSARPTGWPAPLRRRRWSSTATPSASPSVKRCWSACNCPNC